MAGTIETSTINVISPNGLVTKPLTVDNYGYAKIGDERVGVTPQNWIINGQFDVWQRGTSQTSSGYGSDDRWQNLNSVSTKTNSRQTFTIGQTDVPNNPTYFSRTVVSSGGTASSFIMKRQMIEDVTKLSGKTITISFWAKADSSKNMSIEFMQEFGDGGSDGVGGLGIQKFSLTTLWQRFTKTVALPRVTGKTINANNRLTLFFYFDAGSDFNARTDSLGNQSGTFDIANVCLVEGSVPVECPNEPYAEVLRKCQRYYVRFSNPLSTQVFASAIANYATQSYFVMPLPVQMRTSPSAIDYGGSLVFWKLGIGNYDISALAIAVSADKTIQLVATHATGLTVGDVGFILTSVAGGYVGLSAEL